MPIEYDPSREALYSPERRETLFEPGGTYSPLQLAVEAARLAYYRAETSAVEKARLAEALARVGFSDPVLFVDATTGGEGYAAYRGTDGAAVLAFRGTQPDDQKDVVTDARANLVPWPESGGCVHAGFAASARALIPDIRRWLDGARPDPDKLIVTGHSLGAALATLMATILRPRLLVTLGSPRVGDHAFTIALTTANVVRLVNCCDAVTDVPPPVRYEHVRGCRYLTRDAKTLEDPSLFTITGDRLRAHLQYTLRYAWKAGAVRLRSLADHAPINYARVIFP